MSRTLLAIALSLLFVEFLSAQDNPVKNPKAQPDAVKKEIPDAPVKKQKIQPDEVKKDNPEAPVKNPKGQPDGVKKHNPDPIKKEGKPDGDKPKDKGRITKFDVEGSTIKLTVDGKEYAFMVSDNTRAMMKSKEVDGKETVLSLQLYNASEGDKKDFVKKEGVKKVDDAEVVKKKVAKPDDVKKPEKKPE